MDKASDFESEDCEFESRRGQNVLTPTMAACYTDSTGQPHTSDVTVPVWQDILCAVLGPLYSGCWQGAK